MKTAVILFNLGGPATSDDVFPFLKSLFSDPAILTLPNPFRGWLAHYIAWKRTPKAKEIFTHLGGGSPLLENTTQQARALENVLGESHKVFVAMRHAPPLIEMVAQDVQVYRPDKIVLLPLYPQFSDTTTGSALREWEKATHSFSFQEKTKTICCYPGLPGIAQANAELIRQELLHFRQMPRVLFSAHGLPEKLIKAGDPYVIHVAETTKAILKEAPEIKDWSICYQSRVGYLPWTKPDLGTEIKRAAEEKKGVLVVPLSFVNEHSETLVELDITYKAFAHEVGVLEYGRLSTVSCHPLFIQGLADLVKKGMMLKPCPEFSQKCWQKNRQR